METFCSNSLKNLVGKAANVLPLLVEHIGAHNQANAQNECKASANGQRGAGVAHKAGRGWSWRERGWWVGEQLGLGAERVGRDVLE